MFFPLSASWEGPAEGEGLGRTAIWLRLAVKYLLAGKGERKRVCWMREKPLLCVHVCRVMEKKDAS